MIMKKYRLFLLAGMAGVIITGCGQKTLIDTVNGTTAIEKSSESTVMEEETIVKQEESSAVPESGSASEGVGGICETTLEELAGLLGMADSETADLFGGGQENWSAGNQFYIGRNYRIDLYGTQYTAHTSCDTERRVSAVSVWIVSGERQVTDGEVQAWIERITEMTGTEPVYDNESSEAGSRNCKWLADGRIITMNRMADILSINFNPAVGEMK